MRGQLWKDFNMQNDTPKMNDSVETLPVENSALATIANNHAALAAFEEEARDDLQSGIAFLKFTKQGEWVWGSEEIDIEDSDELAVNMASYAKGFICWDDGVPIDEVMEIVATGRTVEKSHLDDHDVESGSGNGWKGQTSVNLKILSDGRELRFSSTSKGGRTALSKLSKEFVSRLRRDENDLVPIVRLSGDSYKHKKYGNISTPVIEIVRWGNEKDLNGAGFDVISEDDLLPNNTEQEKSHAEEPDGQGKRKLSG